MNVLRAGTGGLWSMDHGFMDHGWSFDNGEFGGLSVRMAPFLERAMQLVLWTIATSRSMSSRQQTILFLSKETHRCGLAWGWARLEPPGPLSHFTSSRIHKDCYLVALLPIHSRRLKTAPCPHPVPALNSRPATTMAKLHAGRNASRLASGMLDLWLRHTKAITSSPYSVHGV